MGKNNNRNNNNRRENYFDQKIKQGGEGFMMKMTQSELKKDCNRILKDIAYANIDYNNKKYLQYFADPNLVQLLVQVSYENWNYNNVTCIGLENYFQSGAQYTANDMQVYTIHCDARNAYTALYNGLNELLQYLVTCNNNNSQVYANPVIDILYCLTNQVVQYNKGMNYTFIVVVDNDRRQYNNDKGTRNQTQRNVQGVPNTSYSG